MATVIKVLILSICVSPILFVIYLIMDDILHPVGIFAEDKKVPSAEKSFCDHKYKPFDPVYSGEYDISTHLLNYQLTQSFVCLKCGHRVDKTLREGRRVFDTFDKANEFANNTFPYARNPEQIESEIAKIQLKVDDDYIAAYESLKNTKSEFESFLYKEAPKKGEQKMEV